MDKRVPAAAMAIALLFTGVPSANQAARTLDQLLDRGQAHVAALVTRLTRVVAEEQYLQEYLVAGIEGSRGNFKGAPRVVERRKLTSDVLLVKLADLEQWLVFRDVFDVDGKPVRDRQDRLMKLFVESRDTVAAVEQAIQIGAESARFNIKPIGTVDNPLLALGFLQSAYRPRFRFTMRGRDTSAGADAWIVEFRETQRPSIIRTGGDRDIFARGRYWIADAEGRVLRTEVTFNALGTTSTITTTYGLDEQLKTSVPTEMRFTRINNANEQVQGVATYGRFRQFEVGTNEAIKK
jgi:hypothetical protein